mgnify:CR=1 FL=1
MRKVILVIMACFFLSSCGPTSNFSGNDNPPAEADFVAGKGDVLRIVSGSENEELEPIIEEYAQKNRVQIQVDYLGSLEIMNLLSQETIDYDAVWPASSIWINMGDVSHRLKHTQSISTTPVVFGIRESKAKELGLMRDDVMIEDIAQLIEAGQLSFAMTSATQSNSGASAYLAFLTALSGSGEVLTTEALEQPALQAQISNLLSGVNRSSGSSNWLVDLFLKSHYDAMVNYEALIISANKQFVAQGDEPLALIYVKDAISIADSPLAFIDKGDSSDKEKIFLSFQAYLLSKDTQNKIEQTGRRDAYGNIDPANEKVFAEWGIDTKMVLSPITLPKAETIRLALNLYQTTFKKPALTLYCLDFSGSMSGEGNDQMMKGLEQLLIAENAREHFLQGTTNDVSYFIPFDSDVLSIYQANGNDAELEQAYERLRAESPGGGTDVYAAILEALKRLDGYELANYTPAIVLLTDGRSMQDNEDEVVRQYQAMNLDVPIFSIMYGDADPAQLEALADLTNARVFDGRKDLTDAFKKVKGYN